jgi:hypothetical protein
MQQARPPTPFRTRAPHAPPPLVTMCAKPVKPWLVLTAVLFGCFMALLDTTIVNIAIPSIQTDLSADLLSTAVLVWLSLKPSQVWEPVAYACCGKMR